MIPLVQLKKIVDADSDSFRTESITIRNIFDDEEEGLHPTSARDKEEDRES